MTAKRNRADTAKVVDCYDIGDTSVTAARCEGSPALCGRGVRPVMMGERWRGREASCGPSWRAARPDWRWAIASFEERTKPPPRRSVAAVLNGAIEL